MKGLDFKALNILTMKHFILFLSTVFSWCDNEFELGGDSFVTAF